MKISELAGYLETIAPLELQESYDNAGLIVGDPDKSITGVLCALDATAEVVEEARKLGCNLIVCHHPIIFKGLKKINGGHYVERAVIHAIRHDIAIYAAHTNLDSVLQNGVNQKIAQKLGLSDLSILQPRAGDPAIGLGLIGSFPEPLEVETLLHRIKVSMEAGVVRHTPVIQPVIRRLALCGGSGAFLIREAIAAGADAYLTADIKYHEFFEANGQILLLDIGHFESEQFTVELLFELISKK
ncbi:MAG TPA: Nif3-like dinuclear metal center hexameric protein, partial [Saprospiraceae bacterium]|nr:Nif3-like dinuclear metal center hexameric protein [Saprospiraceae bacterium]